jgi:ribose transport system permease protein
MSSERGAANSGGRRFRFPSLSGPVLGLVIVLTLFVLLIRSKGEEELRAFLGLRNVQVLVQQCTVPGVAALGMLLIIISGGIDLSAGSVVALVTVVAMRVYRARYPAPDASVQAVAAGVGVGFLCGLLNGTIITRLRLSPFVATLGMFSMARGAAYWVSERRVLSFPGAEPEWVHNLAVAIPERGLFNPGFWILLILAMGVALYLRYTVWGLHCYAIGSNEAAARLCGVSINGNKVLTYTLAGLLMGCAGILQFARGRSGDPDSGRELELRVIAAVVIGGASLSGGQGTVTGALLGVLILEILNNGVNSFDVPVEVQYILIGLIIILNTALSHWQRGSEKR